VNPRGDGAARSDGGDAVGHLDPTLRQALVARAAAILFLASGFLTIVSAGLGPASTRSATIGVALVAAAIGVGVWFAPWQAWPTRASFWLAPTALVLIAIGGTFGTTQPYDYAVYFAVVHAWVGIAHPRWSSVVLSPLTAIAYAVPLLFIAPHVSTALVSGITVVPLCVLMGESIAWLRAQLDHSESDRGRLRDALEERRRAERRLSFLAYHDPVTDLPNRALFDEHFAVAIANAQRSGESLAVCAVDLDKFKLVNDTLGHAAGDELLREVALRLNRSLRRGDVLARVGGDEFLALLAFPGSGSPRRPTSEEAQRVTERLIARMSRELERPCEIADTELHVSASIGAAVFPVDGVDADVLLAHADTQMYRRKRGRAQRDRSAAPPPDRSLSARLESAARTNPWTLRYQPIVELVLGRAVGAEALIRWPDASGAEVPPARFIPLAEEMGLISAIGSWIVGELEVQLRAWRADGTLDHLSALTTNVSPRQLWHPALLEMFGRLVDAAGRRDLIVLEITESALGMDPGRALTTLDEVRALGARVALDDFGTGYSSLSRLRSLPIDIVKIDRSFMEDVDVDPSARSVLKSMIRLIGSLEMVPLVEGIETAAQLEFVRDEGCVLAQGFRLGRPARPASLAERVRRDARAVISLDRSPRVFATPD
jgi:diguanylate cyclase (GGDEF)-like protein